MTQIVKRAAINIQFNSHDEKCHQKNYISRMEERMNLIQLFIVYIQV